MFSNAVGAYAYIKVFTHTHTHDAILARNPECHSRAL